MLFHKLIQSQMRCTSIMIDMEVTSYLSLIQKPYVNQGGLSGQRAPLKTKTARTVRERMVSDIVKGAVLPPLVVGVLVNDQQYSTELQNIVDPTAFLAFVQSLSDQSVMIIDGMQRTTAIEEARQSPSAVISNVRVEFWISDSVANLIYRMLVLNTGQVPWEVARQLETIYKPLVNEIKNLTVGGIKVFSLDEGAHRRFDTDEYSTEKLVELLLIFSSRKRDINLKDQLAQDFARIDMIESSSHAKFLEYFSRAIIILGKFDSAVSTFFANANQLQSLERFKTGSDLFETFTAKVGFISALSIYLFNMPGFDPEWNLVEVKLAEVESGLVLLSEKIKNKVSPEDKAEILQFDELDERLAKHRISASQVGRFEREYFEKAFLMLFKNITSITNLSPCWVAY